MALLAALAVHSLARAEADAPSGEAIQQVQVQQDIGLHAGGPFALAGRRHEAAFGAMRMKQSFHSDNRAADFGAAYPEPRWGAPTFYEGSDTIQDAWYGVTRLSLADPLKLILGARVTDYKKEGRGLWTAAYSIRHEREVTPYAGLVFDIDEHYSAYASYTDIFQPQNLKDANGDLLAPVIGRNVEAGVKGAFFDGRLNGSLALFQVRQDGLARKRA